MCLAIFDVDGTLTKQGYPYWNLINEQIIFDREALASYTSDWDSPDKKSLRAEMSDVDLIEASKLMIEKCLNLNHDLTPEAIIEAGYRVSLRLLDERVVYSEAINLIRRQIDTGLEILLSTASYREGAQGLIKALVDRGYLLNEDREKIHIQGVDINWDHGHPFEVEFANVGQNKSKLSMHLADKEVVGIWCDDPYGNDRGLLSLVEKPKRHIVLGKLNREEASKVGIPCLWQSSSTNS